MNKYLPNAPQNVRAVLTGNIEIPMRLQYVGVGPNGENVWAALWPVDMEPPSWDDFQNLRVDTLPEMTAIMLPVTHKTDGMPHWEPPAQ